MTSMASDRRQQIKDIFQAALELKANERAAFLKQACGGDESLRREVESLLAYAEKTAGLISISPIEAFRSLEEQLDRSLLGQTIDHYKILAWLGAGGMGKVYLAEDQRLNRKVALKLLPGVFAEDADYVHRLEQEARAVSALNHPNIITV